jgi:ADP-glucose pyrophosphorylase
MILAGGEGRRLHPLTADRAKPAVPFGGRYRIIDIVLSNMVNSGLSRIKVITQYKSASLEEHIARAWRLSPMLDSYIETIPAQQRTGLSWFKGSADAVYQTLHVIVDEQPEQVCIFGGDHVYKMDVRQMLVDHLGKDADITVAAIPVTKAEARERKRLTDKMLDRRDFPERAEYDTAGSMPALCLECAPAVVRPVRSLCTPLNEPGSCAAVVISTSTVEPDPVAVILGPSPVMVMLTAQPRSRRRVPGRCRR